MSESVFAVRELIERANRDQHQFPRSASDLITELSDELDKALLVVAAALAVDGHTQGFPPMVPPSLVAPFRDSLAPYRRSE